MMRLSRLTLIEMGYQALAFQKKNGNFDLCIRDLQHVWGYASTSAAHYPLKRMIRLRLIQAKRVGKKTHIYRAAEM